MVDDASWEQVVRSLMECPECGKLSRVEFLNVERGTRLSCGCTTMNMTWVNAQLALSSRLIENDGVVHKAHRDYWAARCPCNRCRSAREKLAERTTNDNPAETSRTEAGETVERSMG